MHCWKGLTKLYKFTINEHRKNWIPRASKRTKKEEKKSKQANFTLSVRMPEIVMFQRSNAMKKIRRVCTECSNATNVKEFRVRTLDAKNGRIGCFMIWMPLWDVPMHRELKIWNWRYGSNTNFGIPTHKSLKKWLEFATGGSI